MTLARLCGRLGRRLLVPAVLAVSSAGSLAPGAEAAETTAGPVACPRVSILAEAANLYRFAPGTTPSAQTVSFAAQVLDARMTCTTGANGQLTGQLHVKVLAKRGPAGASLTTVKLPYFIAITQTNVKVLTRGVYDLDIPLDPKSGSGGLITDDSLSLPITNGLDSKGYEIIVGIQLSDAELQFNRGQAK